MKYLEELNSGDCFEFDGYHYIKSVDYKKNGDQNCIDLKNGNSRWLQANSIVNVTPIYILDKENNIVAIKPMDKEDV